MSETAIVVTVPEAERIVGRWRRELTEDGGQGMPAHVTLISPFGDTSQLNPRRLGAARDVVAAFAAFEFFLTSVAYFESERRLLYLEPEPAHVFRALVEALMTRFPQHPPYGGVHSDVIPHLTVAESDDHETLRQIERELQPALPIRARVVEAVLMELRPDTGWSLHTALPLSA